MTTERFVITDHQWALMEPHCLGKETDPGRTGFWRRCSGLRGPAVHGVTFRRTSENGIRCSIQFRDWVKADVFQRLFDDDGVSGITRDSLEYTVLSQPWHTGPHAISGSVLGGKLLNPFQIVNC